MNSSKQPRRQFLQMGATAVVTSVFGTLPHISYPQSLQADGEGIIVHEEEGVHILTRRKVPITIKISKAKNHVNGISFCVEKMEPGRKMRIHKHLHNDELIFIHGGKGTLTLGAQTIEVETGAVVFVPRGVWHGLDNTGRGMLQMIFQYTPAGFEEYFIENGAPVGMPARERTPEQLKATEKKYGMVYKETTIGK
jgi:quercetin dioxygenase-like cupin family protein